MVNLERKEMRCTTTGYGNVIAMSAAEFTYDRCVEKMRMIGHVKIPEVHIRISPDWKTNPASFKSVKDRRRKSACAGDQILQKR